MTSTNELRIRYKSTRAFCTLLCEQQPQYIYQESKLLAAVVYFAKNQLKLVSRPFEHSKLHSTLDFGIRLARKKSLELIVLEYIL